MENSANNVPAKDLAGKKVLVIGVGRSGVGAVSLLTRHGAQILLLEQNAKASEEKILGKFTGDEKAATELLIGDLPEGRENEFSMAVLSPAVPADSPIALRLLKARVPVLSELELAFRYDRGTVLAITGTNGKTTTTTLVGEIMKAHNEKTFVVGNIGYSYAAAADSNSADSVSVAEVSSFQLEWADTFHPHITAILNITPDHLNRHYTMQNYAAIKERITRRQTAEDRCILNYDDIWLRPFGENICPAGTIWFSSSHVLEEGYYYKDGVIHRAFGGSDEPLLSMSEIRLVGVCNAENVMAAIAMTEAAGVPMETILKVVKEFPPVPHRIEFVGEKDGVRYYNDSKATNPDAAIQGIRAMDRPTVLIGGGYDKKNSYDEWIEAFDGKVKELVLIGATKEAIAEAARRHGITRIRMFETFEDCLRHCTEAAQPGDAVLLSPACASWGMFPDYEVRGDCFREYVQKL